MSTEPNVYEVLKSKEIIEILDGDVGFGYTNCLKNKKEIRMPYLSGNRICEISGKFGYDQNYNFNNTKSRYEYMQNLMDFCIKNDSINSLLNYLFSLTQFQDVFKGMSVNEIKDYHKCVIEIIIEKINGVLYPNGKELCRQNNSFVIRGLNDQVILEAPSVENIDYQYIKSISQRAYENIASHDYDSAITKSRTLLEEVFCYVIEKKKEIPLDKGDIKRLYKQVKDLYQMHINKQTDDRIKELLSGLEKILNSIGNMRNDASDSHGIGSKRINIDGKLARLYVNTSLTMSEYILEVCVENENK